MNRLLFSLKTCQKSGAHFSEKKKAPAATYPQVQGFQKYGGHFFWKKKRLRQRTHKLRASRNMGHFLWRKKAPAATYPQVRGFQKYGWNLYTPSRTRFSNGMAYNRSKVSVKKISNRVRRYSLFEIYLPIYVKYLWEWLDEEICISGTSWIFWLESEIFSATKIRNLVWNGSIRLGRSSY